VDLPKWRFDTFFVGIVLPFIALQYRPDLIHTRSLASAWGMTNIYRIPTIFEIHDALSMNRVPKTLFSGIVKSSSLRTLVTITNSLAASVRNSAKNSTPLVVVPDGVISKWVERQETSATVRAALGLENEQRRIAVYSGHLYRGRGIELIVKLAEKVPDHLFLVVGGKDATVEQYRQACAGIENIRFVGFRPPSQVFEYLLAADVLLMPHGNAVEGSDGGDISLFTSPLKMFEYMAAGRPILASTLPVLQEILKDGANALLRPYDDIDSWVKAIRELQNDPQLCASISRQAHEDVAPYTWHNRAKRLLDICNNGKF
jgi:glycosyltransferase involved in cell wall biosynthesis